LYVYDYLQNCKTDHLKHITINDLRNASCADDVVLFKVINYLTGQSLPLLSIGYEYIVGNEIHLLDEEEVDSILKDDVLYFDGYPVKNWKENTFIFFYANKELEGYQND